MTKQKWKIRRNQIGKLNCMNKIGRCFNKLDKSFAFLI